MRKKQQIVPDKIYANVSEWSMTELKQGTQENETNAAKEVDTAVAQSLILSERDKFHLLLSNRQLGVMETECVV